eukprot:352804-Chlamydomonas_euryale.AAC.2
MRGDHAAIVRRSCGDHIRADTLPCATPNNCAALIAKHTLPVHICHTQTNVRRASHSASDPTTMPFACQPGAA